MMIEKLDGFNPKIHFFVCINDRAGRASEQTAPAKTSLAPSSEKPSCGPFIDETKVKEIKRWIVSQGLTGKVFMTKTGCLGGCNSDGAVIATYPAGVFHKGFQSTEDIKNFVLEHIADLA